VSPLWRAWEKWVAVLAPVAINSVALLVIWAVTSVAGGDAQQGFSEVGRNPLVPTGIEFGFAHSVLLVGFLLLPVSGLWLLWRLRVHSRR
jgi:hypothetical protein